jgi:hypothetical protein
MCYGILSNKETLMLKRILLPVVIALLIASCQPTDQPLPTLVAFPTDTPSPEASNTPTELPTATATMTDTPSPTPTLTPLPTDTATATELPSETPTASPTSLATATPNAREVARDTATAQVIEAPVYATFTPIPPGVIAVIRPTSTGVPEMVADIIIYEYQFQEEIDRILGTDTRISTIRLDFVPAGITVELTATGGAAFVTGTFTVNFMLNQGGFNNILIIGGMTDFAMRSGGEPPQDFVELAASVVVPAVQEAFDFILNQRLGTGRHNLESIVLNDTQMGITLLVPDPNR